jgi:hypothetical protein
MRTVEEIIALKKRYNHLYHRNVECERRKPENQQHAKARQVFMDMNIIYNEPFCEECESFERCEQLDHGDESGEEDYPCYFEDEPKRPYTDLELVISRPYKDEVIQAAREALGDLDTDIPEIAADLDAIFDEEDGEPKYWDAVQEVCDEDCNECQWLDSCRVSFT